ncbi:MAG TPA: ABC transporter permease subunit [Acidobacteriota bacterium]|nr:ABC transporter permease subunit [Acidobacteriota bacterium]
MKDSLPQPGVVAAIARQELRLTLRNRWLASYAAVLAVLTLAVSYFGLAVIEYTGFQGFDRTAISLLNLVLYIVPLAAMMMGTQSFRAEGGATEQLFTEPVLSSEIVLGKLGGLAASHLLATLLGFGLSGALIAFKVGSRGFLSYLYLVGFTLAVGWVFIALSSLLCILSGRTTRAYAVVLVVWFFLVLLFDLLVIGLSFLLPELWANRLAVTAVFLNPIDATRVAAMLSLAGSEVYGPAGAQLLRWLGSLPRAVALLSLTLAAWFALSAWTASFLLRRRDL